MAKCAHVLRAPVFCTPGMTIWRLWTVDFLFVCSTHPRRLLWLHHAVISMVGRWLSELRANFPIKVSCRVAIYYSMLGISNNVFLPVSFMMCWSFTSSILMPNMRRMLCCRNTSSFFRSDVQSDHLSHPHSNILMGMARNMRYLLWLLTLASVQNLVRAPIDAFPDARHVPMSESSQREHEM